MTNRDFKEAMHAIACSDSADKYYCDAINRKKRKKVIRDGMFFSLIIIAAMICIIGVGIIKQLSTNELSIMNGELKKTIISDEYDKTCNSESTYSCEESNDPGLETPFATPSNSTD